MQEISRDLINGNVINLTDVIVMFHKNSLTTLVNGSLEPEAHVCLQKEDNF
jgi:hypothetical protein